MVEASRKNTQRVILALLSRPAVSENVTLRMVQSAGDPPRGESFRSISGKWTTFSNFTAAMVLFTQQINASQSPCNSFFEFTCKAQNENDRSTFGSNLMEIAEELLSTPAKDEVCFTQFSQPCPGRTRPISGKVRPILA